MWCAVWSYCAPKAGQVRALLHLHCFLKGLSSTGLGDSAVVIPTTGNSISTLQKFQDVSITISTSGSFGADHGV